MAVLTTVFHCYILCYSAVIDVPVVGCCGRISCFFSLGINGMCHGEQIRPLLAGQRLFVFALVIFAVCGVSSVKCLYSTSV